MGRKSREKRERRAAAEQLITTGESGGPQDHAQTEESYTFSKRDELLVQRYGMAPVMEAMETEGAPGVRRVLARFAERAERDGVELSASS
jgi:hypothetical protein